MRSQQSWMNWLQEHKIPDEHRFYSATTSGSEVFEQVELNLQRRRSIGIIFLDIVGLTHIEQHYGAPVARRVLKTVTRSILQARPLLSVGRTLFVHNVGGDDFVLYYSLPSVGTLQGLDFLECLAEDLCTQVLSSVNRQLQGVLQEPLDLHRGWSILLASSELSLETLIYKGLKEARQMAKGNEDAKWTRQVWELREAIKEERFSIHYQPLVDMASGKIMGYEALSRGPSESSLQWSQGLADLAEKSNLLFPLERLLRQKAVQGTVNWPKDVRLFVNISPQVIQDPDFTPENLLQLVHSVGRDPGQIVFEITERQSIDDFRSFDKKLERFRNVGFQVAVDDAGAGYSSLQSIAEIIPDYIKIDMSLIHHIDTSVIKQAMAEIFVSFAKRLGIQIIAEGIETEAELRWLHRLGVDIGQGYFLGRPSPEKKALTGEAQRVLGELKQQKPADEMGTMMPVGELVEAFHGLAQNAPTHQALDFFQTNSNAFSLVIVDGMRPVGLLMRDKLYGQMVNKYGLALYGQRPVSLIMDRNPLIVDTAMRIDRVAHLATARQMQRLYDHIIVVNEEKVCVGVVSVRALLDQMTGLQIERALGANPLTGMPGNLQIKEDMERRCEAGQAFTVIYADLDHFKAFNDYYGFEQGDQAIKLTAQILSTAVQNQGCPDDFVGHIGGDDWIIVTTSSYQELCDRIVCEFDRRIGELYLERDRQAGYIDGRDRQGNPCRYPVMSISLSVVTGRFAHVSQIGEVAARVKKRAKQQPGSGYVVEEVKVLTLS
ncbi:EAL domain-containing protein [Heliophilum fasciatum]|uniref:Diguanylate cyclase (GGDEF)-like protein n=1 Tax=Heliophilum fasciatum TaxID=35700 RepID=A0A4R2RH68_9FIRM|nr:EAL domain-containing protein [Heliophilum fasciatum]MCW2278874.1 diguanylate cyclase (GGDEF)-like protein [Heliophilum fasciatum]TCP62114.1 diguanylate cyclase (GGDEF)-like protein [Heliophilum fasciatum]